MGNLLRVNEHPVERVIRVVLGLFLLSLLFWGPHTWLGLIGIVPLATGIVGSCPLYTLFGFRTCRMSKSET
jgi:Inner membrane protein YgaP-like, transmembrane domain